MQIHEQINKETGELEVYMIVLIQKLPRAIHIGRSKRIIIICVLCDERVCGLAMLAAIKVYMLWLWFLDIMVWFDIEKTYINLNHI